MGKKILQGEYLQNANKAAQEMLDNGFSEQEIADFTKSYVEKFGVDEDVEKKSLGTSASSNTESQSTKSNIPLPPSVTDFAKSTIENAPPEVQQPIQQQPKQPEQPKKVTQIQNTLPSVTDVAMQSIKIAGKQVYANKKNVVTRYPVQDAEQEAFEIYKNTPYLPESVKKQIGDEGAKKIISSYLKKVTDPTLEVSPLKAEEVLFTLTKNKRDAEIKDMAAADILGYDQIGKIVAGNDHLNSRLGKVAGYLTAIKNGDSLSPNDVAYLQKAAPAAWSEMTLNGQIAPEALPDYYGALNSSQKVLQNRQISESAIGLSKQLGFDVENYYNDNAQLSIVQNKIQERKEAQIAELEKQYPYPFGSPYRDAKFYEKKRELESSFAMYSDVIATASTQLWANNNPKATPLEVGKHYMSIADPDRLKLFELSGADSRKVAGEIAREGYKFMYATGNPQMIKRAYQEEKKHDDLYPDEKIDEVYHKIGAELFKRHDNILMHTRPTIEEMDHIANTQFSQKDRDIYFKHIRPAEDSRFWGTNVPTTGFLNKTFESFGTSMAETWKGAQDLFGVRGTKEQAKESLEGVPVGLQEVGEYEKGKQRLQELKSKPSLTFDEIQERRDLEKYVDVRNYWAKGSDLIGNTTGQVLEMAIGGKGAGMLGKAFKVAKVAKEISAVEQIGMGAMSHMMSYDQARRDLLQLKPDATEAELTVYGNIIGLANAFSEHIFNDPKVLQAFAKEVSPAAQRIFENLTEDGVRSLTTNQFRGAMEKFIKRDLVNFAKKYGENVGQEVVEEEVVQVATSILDGIMRPDKFNAKAEWDKVVATAVQTAVGMTLIGGVGGIRDVRANSVTTQLMNSVGYDKKLAQEVKDIINSEHAEGNISNEEKNEKLKVINTIESIHNTTLKAANEIRPLSKVENEKITMLTLQERMLNDKINQLPYGDTKDILQKQVNDLKAKRNQIIQKEVVVDDDYNLVTVDDWNRNNISQAGDIAGGVINNYLQNKKDPATASKIVTDYDGTIVNSKGEFTRFGMDLKNRIASGDIGPDDVKIITARHEKDAQMIADKLGIDVNNITAVGGTEIEKTEGVPAAKKAAYERLARYSNLSPLIDNDKANVDATGGILYQDEKAAEKDTITPAAAAHGTPENISKPIELSIDEPAPVIPVRNNDFVNKFFTDEEKAQYNQLDPDSDEAKAMVKAKRKVVAQDILNKDAVKDGEAEVSNQTPSGSAPTDSDKPKTSNDYADHLLDLIEGKQKELGWEDADKLRKGLVDEFIKTAAEKNESRAIANLESLYVQYLPKEERAGAYQTIRENFKNKDNATPESENQQQEGNKPSGDGQHQGTVQGQQKPQQEGVGQQGQAQKPPADNSNSGIRSKEEEVEPVDLTKIKYEPKKEFNKHDGNEAVEPKSDQPVQPEGKGNIVTTPSSEIISQLSKIPTVEGKLNWLRDNGYLQPIVLDGKEYNAVDYEDRIIVLMKIGGVNIPFYISTGQAGKKNVKAGDWYAIFGIGESGWINKGTEELINSQYDSPVLQKIAKILNEGIGTIQSRDNNGNGKLYDFIGFMNDIEHIDQFNPQMNLPITPAKNSKDSEVFWENVKTVLGLVNDELRILSPKADQPVQPEGKGKGEGEETPGKPVSKSPDESGQPGAKTATPVLETPEMAWIFTKDGKVVEGVVDRKGKGTTNVLVDGTMYTRVDSEVFANKEDAEKYFAETPIDEPDERLSKSIRDLHEKGYESDSSKEPLREVMRHFFNNGEMAFKPVADYLTKLVDDRSPEFIEVLKGVYLGESLDYDNLDNKNTINSYEPATTAAAEPIQAEPQTTDGKAKSQTEKVRTSRGRKSTSNDEGEDEREGKIKTPLQQVREINFSETRNLEGLVYQMMLGIKYNRGVLYEIFGSGGKANSQEARRNRGGRDKRYFGKNISGEIASRAAFMNPKKGQRVFETVDDIAHYIHENLNSQLGGQMRDEVIPYKLDAVTNFVIEAISEGESPTQLAQYILDNPRFNVNKQTQADIEKAGEQYKLDQLPVGIDPITGEWLPGFEAERELWEKYEGEAIDHIAELTDAEFEEMMKDQDEFRQWEIEQEDRKSFVSNEARKMLDDIQLTDEQVVNLDAKDQFRYSQVEERINELKKLIDCLNG